MPKFTNYEVPHEQITSIESLSFTPLQPVFIRGIRWIIVSNWFAGLVVLWIGIILLKHLPILLAIILTIIGVVGLLINLYFTRYIFRARGYCLREHDFIYRHGVFIHSIDTIPLARVQQVSISQSFMAQRIGYYSITLATASGEVSDIKIDGLAQHEAENLRNYIVSYIKGNRNEGL